MSKGRAIPLPKNKYVEKIEINDADVRLHFKKRKKIALLFICLNEHYWPYLVQVVKDCKEKFLPQHLVDFHVWTDMPSFPEKAALIKGQLETTVTTVRSQPLEQALKTITDFLIPLIGHYQLFPAVLPLLEEMKGKGIVYKRDSEKMWMEVTTNPSPWMVEYLVSVANEVLSRVEKEVNETLAAVHVHETEPTPWPTPTLMRYHLFLNEEETLAKYDYMFYLDADMRVVDKISDEILCEGLTAAEHPMYSLRTEYVPPYEPNEESTAYIPRPGAVVDEDGKKRFKPYYYAGGFQGGKTAAFLAAMKKMKKNIDSDFNKNYIAIWNDESHWNRYLFDYKGPTIVLSPSYIYPDSLIDDYYVKVWGKKYEPKIITLTKPFSISKQGGEQIQKYIQSS